MPPRTQSCSSLLTLSFSHLSRVSSHDYILMEFSLWLRPALHCQNFVSPLSNPSRVVFIPPSDLSRISKLSRQRRRLYRFLLRLFYGSVYAGVFPSGLWSRGSSRVPWLRWFAGVRPKVTQHPSRHAVRQLEGSKVDNKSLRICCIFEKINNGERETVRRGVVSIRRLFSCHNRTRKKYQNYICDGEPHPSVNFASNGKTLPFLRATRDVEAD